MSDLKEYPDNSTAKVYSDIDGNEVTLRQLIISTPEWAHSRIKVCEKLEKENDGLKMDLGLAEISREGLKERLESCEAALNERDTKAEIKDKAIDELIYRLREAANCLNCSDNHLDYLELVESYHDIANKHSK